MNNQKRNLIFLIGLVIILFIIASLKFVNDVSKDYLHPQSTTSSNVLSTSAPATTSLSTSNALASLVVGTSSSENWKTYADTNTGFSFNYPQAGIATTTAGENRIEFPTASDVSATSASSTLVEKYILVQSSAYATDSAACLLPSSGSEVANSNIVIGGTTFTREQQTSAAAGTIYDSVSYVTDDIRSGGRPRSCVLITETVEHASGADFSPPQADYDPTEDFAEFDQIMSTFQLAQ
jgi:hypothetical protein